MCVGGSVCVWGGEGGSVCVCEREREYGRRVHVHMCISSQLAYYLSPRPPPTHTYWL